MKKPSFDPELERYRPNLEEQLKACTEEMKFNEMLFNLETEPELIEERIYEREALQCHYRYLLRQAKEVGMHAVL